MHRRNSYTFSVSSCLYGQPLKTLKEIQKKFFVQRFTNSLFGCSSEVFVAYSSRLQKPPPILDHSERSAICADRFWQCFLGEETLSSPPQLLSRVACAMNPGTQQQCPAAAALVPHRFSKKDFFEMKEIT